MIADGHSMVTPVDAWLPAACHCPGCKARALPGSFGSQKGQDLTVNMNLFAHTNVFAHEGTGQKIYTHVYKMLEGDVRKGVLIRKYEYLML